MLLATLAAALLCDTSFAEASPRSLGGGQRTSTRVTTQPRVTRLFRRATGAFKGIVDRWRGRGSARADAQTTLGKPRPTPTRRLAHLGDLLEPSKIGSAKRLQAELEVRAAKAGYKAWDVFSIVNLRGKQEIAAFAKLYSARFPVVAQDNIRFMVDGGRVARGTEGHWRAALQGPGSGKAPPSPVQIIRRNQRIERSNGRIFKGSLPSLLAQRKAEIDVLDYRLASKGKIRIWSGQRRLISVKQLDKAGFKRAIVGGDTVIVRKTKTPFSRDRVKAAGLNEAMVKVLATVPSMAEYRARPLTLP